MDAVNCLRSPVLWKVEGIASPFLLEMDLEFMERSKYGRYRYAAVKRIGHGSALVLLSDESFGARYQTHLVCDTSLSRPSLQGYRLERCLSIAPLQAKRTDDEGTSGGCGDPRGGRVRVPAGWSALAAADLPPVHVVEVYA